MTVFRIKVCAYCRVSTDSEDQLNSLGNQDSYFRRVASENGAYELVELYADEGLTATSWEKRTDFKRMLEDAGIDIYEDERKHLRMSVSNRAPRFTRILIKDVSRFARDIDAAGIIRLLRQKEVYIDFVTAGLSTESMSDDIVVGILLLLAENESKDRSTKVIFGQLEGAKKGNLMKTSKLYGYRLDLENKTLEIIPEEAAVIRLIFELYNSGEGFRRIIQELEKRGHFTREGKPFVQQSIRRMLTNETYKGWLVRNKFDSPRIFTGRKTARVRPVTDWVIHRDVIPAIVDEDTWDRAEAMREGKLNTVLNRGIKGPRTEFAGRIICGKCGSSYVRNREPKTGLVFYNCGLKKRKGTAVCNARNVKAADIERIVETAAKADVAKWFAKYRDDFCDIIRVTERQKLINRLDRDVTAEVDAKRKELAESDERKRRAAELFIAGSFDRAHLAEMTAGLDERIAMLSREIADLSRGNDEIHAEIADIEAMISEIEALPAPTGDIRRLVKRILIESSGDSALMTLSFGDALRKYIRPKYRGVLSLLENYDAGTVYKL